jgi:hypothetical protein
MRSLVHGAAAFIASKSAEALMPWQAHDASA